MVSLPRPVVVDASVALKWQLLDEPYVRQANALRRDWRVRNVIVAMAPQLFAYEMVNGIVSALRQRRLNLSQATQALDMLTTVGVELREVAPQRVFALALEHRLSAYDAAYLALAQAEGCELWTCDKPFYDSIKGASTLVRWIGEYPAAG
ncbi:MAG: type II toxin-antitoxin system VapC family toxin [Chloroflexi bacterium]|nr:type II toxin-antitoxin system VapC family toxin [Chloroflexota bacterium]